MKINCGWSCCLVVVFAIAVGCAHNEKPRWKSQRGQSIDPEVDVTSLDENERKADLKKIRPVSYLESEAIDASPDHPVLAPPEPGGPPFVDEASDGMTLESLEQLALQHNPAIRQASFGASRAAGIRTQVGLRPNPSIGYFGEEIGNDGTAGLHGAFISQTIVRGDKLAWNRRVISNDVEFAQWQAEAQRLRVLNDIRIQFYTALGAQKRLHLAREFHTVAQKGVDVSKALVRMQQGALPDVLQSEVQLSEVDLAIQRADFEFTAAWNELVSVVGMPGLEPTALIGDLNNQTEERDLDTTFEMILSESPLMAAASSRVSRARANLQRQRVQAIPNLAAQIGVGHDDGTGDEFANVQLSMPIPVHNSNQGNIQAAHAEYCEAVQNVERLRLQIRRNLAQTIRAFQVARASVQQYENSILPRVEKTLELMQKAVDAGEFDFLRVLTARRAYFEANLKYVSALTELAQAETTIDGLLLTGGLENVVTYDGTDELRGAALAGQ